MSPTHSLTHSLTYSLTYSLTHSLLYTHSLTLTHSLIRPVPFISSSFQTVKYPTPLRGPRVSKQKRNLVIKSKVNARKINPYMAAADATLDALLTASFNRKLKL